MGASLKPQLLFVSTMMIHDQKDLKNAGLKATLPRLKILELFENSAERHLSAEDVLKIFLPITP